MDEVEVRSPKTNFMWLMSVKYPCLPCPTRLGASNNMTTYGGARDWSHKVSPISQSRRERLMTLKGEALLYTRNIIGLGASI